MTAEAIGQQGILGLVKKIGEQHEWFVACIGQKVHLGSSWLIPPEWVWDG
jgi:hypothetical protein